MCVCGGGGGGTETFYNIARYSFLRRRFSTLVHIIIGYNKLYDHVTILYYTFVES